MRTRTIYSGIENWKLFLWDPDIAKTIHSHCSLFFFKLPRNLKWKSVLNRLSDSSIYITTKPSCFRNILVWKRQRKTESSRHYTRDGFLLRCLAGYSISASNTGEFPCQKFPFFFNDEHNVSCSAKLVNYWKPVVIAVLAQWCGWRCVLSNLSECPVPSEVAPCRTPLSSPLLINVYFKQQALKKNLYILVDKLQNWDWCNFYIHKYVIKKLFVCF